MTEGASSMAQGRDQAARLRALMAQADLDAAETPAPPTARAEPPPRRAVPLAALQRSPRPAAPTRLAPPPSVRTPLREGWADPAAALRRLSPNGSAASRRNGSPTLLAVASGKGGVGKTSLCVNLAIALARQGVRTALLDGDVGLANADVLCGCAGRRTLAHALLGECSLRETLTPAPGGFLLAAGCAGLPRPLHRSDLASLLEQARALGDHLDAVLIDCGAGVGETVLTLLGGADWRLLLTTPEPASIADAYAVFKQLRSHKVPSQRTLLLINQAHDAEDARRAAHRLRSAAERFLGQAPATLGWLPADPRVAQAARRRRPALLGSRRAPFSRATRALAQRMLRERLVQRAPARRRAAGRLRQLRRLCGLCRSAGAKTASPLPA